MTAAQLDMVTMYQLTVEDFKPRAVKKQFQVLPSSADDTWIVDLSTGSRYCVAKHYHALNAWHWSPEDAVAGWLANQTENLRLTDLTWEAI